MYGPDGRCFGRCHRNGLYHTGDLRIGNFSDATLARAGLGASLRRVLRAVCVNEGGFDAVNTRDSGVLSFGLLQWCLGAGTGAGELGGLLARIAREEPASFERYFRAHGLDVDDTAWLEGVVQRCHLRLDGRRLDDEASRNALRAPLWAYRFWRAAHDARIRRCQLRHAAARIDSFLPLPRAALGGRRVAELLSSELGVALLLDEHVNRPAHVPATLLQAYRACMAARVVPSDTAAWDTGAEGVLLARYLLLRHATSMTSSRERAARIMAAAGRGELSAKRGSYRARRSTG